MDDTGNDEDSLMREVEKTIADADELLAQDQQLASEEEQSPTPPSKRKRGRPAKDNAHVAQLGRAKSNFVDALLSVAGGEKQRGVGPGGKEIYRFPSISDRADALEQLDKHFADQKQTAPGASPEQHNMEDVRATIAKLVDELRPVVDPADGGVVESISDPAAIAAFDRGERAIDKSAPRRDIESDPRVGDRLELGAGHYAIYAEQTGSGWMKWYLFNGADKHSHYAVKGSADAARKHFYENTSAGQAFAKGEKPGPQSTPPPVSTIAAGNTRAVDEFYGDASTHPTSLRVITSMGQYRVKDCR